MHPSLRIPITFPIIFLLANDRGSKLRLATWQACQEQQAIDRLPIPFAAEAIGRTSGTRTPGRVRAPARNGNNGHTGKPR